MPRAGGVYSAPPGTKGTPNTTIESAKYGAFVDDLVADANAARPVTAGGSGAQTAIGAIDNFSTASADIASAATVNLASATGQLVNITGTVTITAFGTLGAGVERDLVFTSSLTLTHNPTSLILPGGANIVTAAGDTARMRSLGGGNWRCMEYQRASVAPFSTVAPTFTDSIAIKSTDAGAGAAPIADLFRDSASPAASDLLAQLQFNGRDSSANKELYAHILAKIMDPTATSEDAILAFSTIIAGVLATRFNIGAGFYAEGVTGGDKGAGTINATDVFVNGFRLGGAPSAILEDQKTSGTGGGNPATTAWTTHALQTEVSDPFNLITLASNQFTATVAGWVEWQVANYALGNGLGIRLFNVTDGVVAGTGITSFSNSSPDTSGLSVGGAPVIAGKAYALQYYAPTGHTNGLGVPLSQGIEVYARVLFWRAG